MCAVNRCAGSACGLDGVGLTVKPAVAGAESLEGSTVASHDLGVQHLGGRDEPRIVLTESTRRSTLHQRAAVGVRQMDALDGKSLQRGGCGFGIGGSLEEFRDRDDGNNELTAAKCRQVSPRRSDLASAGFSIECDQE